MSCLRHRELGNQFTIPLSVTKFVPTRFALSFLLTLFFLIFINRKTWVNISEETNWNEQGWLLYWISLSTPKQLYWVFLRTPKHIKKIRNWSSNTLKVLICIRFVLMLCSADPWIEFAEKRRMGQWFCKLPPFGLHFKCPWTCTNLSKLQCVNALCHSVIMM